MAGIRSRMGKADMIDPKHTPGPREFRSGDDYFIHAGSYPEKFPHRFKEDDVGDYLAYIGNRTSDFGEANARLIAAAPDMLQALLEFVSMFNTVPGSIGDEVKE